MLNWFQRLSHHKKIMAAVRALGLAGPLKRAYYRVASKSDGVFHAEVAGVPISFYASDPSELRMLEELEGADRECFFEALANELKPGDVFYDVGSNIGQYTLLAGRKVGPHGSVIAFEPVQDVFDRLQRNITLNDLSNVRAFHAALGDRTGLGTVVISGFRSRSSRLKRPSMTQSKGKKEEIIQVFKGDDVCLNEHLAAPTVVKIDVEGQEYAVLEGLEGALSQAKCRFLCCEVHRKDLPTGVTVERILSAIRSMGFGQQECISRGQELHVIANKA